MSRRWLAAMAALALAAVATALYTQHAMDLQPCPWCVLQRLIFIAIAAACLIGLGLRRTGAAIALVLAATGIASALWQHFVAAKAASCDLTLADRIMGASGLDGRWPEVFMATASCADSKVDLLGVPYEFWSLGVFAVIAAAALRVLSARRR